MALAQSMDARVVAASAVIARAAVPTQRRVDDEWVLLAYGAADDNIVGLTRLTHQLVLAIERAMPAPLAEVTDLVCGSVDTWVADGPFGFSAAARADARRLVFDLVGALASGRSAWDPVAALAPLGMVSVGQVSVGNVTKALGIAALAALRALAEVAGLDVRDLALDPWRATAPAPVERSCRAAG